MILNQGATQPEKKGTINSTMALESKIFSLLSTKSEKWGKSENSSQSEHSSRYIYSSVTIFHQCLKEQVLAY